MLDKETMRITIDPSYFDNDGNGSSSSLNTGGEFSEKEIALQEKILALSNAVEYFENEQKKVKPLEGDLMERIRRLTKRKSW